MSYFKTCPFCGSNLDPGEVCDCQIGAALLLAEGAAEQWENEKTAHGATNTMDGKETTQDR